MTNLVKKLRKPIFTDANGKQWKYVGFDRDTYRMTAYYESIENPGKFIDIDVDFVSQQGEIYDNGGIETYDIEPGTYGYDYGRAVMSALDEAHAILSERRAA